jgi:putative methionine-R-sulfoxide reductase with GAF domain
MIPTSIADALARRALDDALRCTLDHFGCQAGTVHVLEDGVLKLRGSVGIPPQVTAIVETVPIGKGIAGLAAERRAPVTICNLQTDTSGQARPGARQTGMEGSLAVPMLDESGALRGVLGIAKADAYDWPEAETQQVLAVAAEFARHAA